MSSNTRIVQTDESKRAHIIRLGMFFDGEGKAVCGERPFPERWYIVNGGKVERKELCPGCMTRVRL